MSSVKMDKLIWIIHVFVVLHTAQSIPGNPYILESNE